MEKSEKKKIILAIVIATLILLAILAFLAWMLRANAEADAALAATETELAVKSLVLSEKDRRERMEAESLENLQSERDALTAALIERDRQELLMLVGPQNPLPADYEPRLVAIGKTDAGGNDLVFDERAAGALKQMIQDCLKSGWAPVPISTYRTQEYQQQLFDDKIERLIAEMQTPQDQLEEVAARSVARPGTSEHQSGFAADIVDEFYPSLDNSQAWSNTQQWLMHHCSEYGFILRYPENTTDITGIIYEPWHYRYVGRAIAQEITDKGITLEGYLNS